MSKERYVLIRERDIMPYGLAWKIIEKIPHKILIRKKMDKGGEKY